MDITVLRDQFLKLLQGRNAHLSFQDAVADFPFDHINSRAPSIPYSPWELIEHLRIAQYDILDFIENADYQERKWPDEYWPPKGKKASVEDWQRSIKQFNINLEALTEIVKNPQTDFTSPIPHAPDYTILREILLVADHNAYHTGQIICLKRVLNIY